MKENKSKKSRIGFILPIIVALGVVFFIVLKEDEPDRIENLEHHAPLFTHEGTLSFISATAGDTVKTIDIEIADNPNERMMGLMHRQKMPYNQGMLFIFDRSERQSFWMRNTRFALDIMYVDSNLRIIDIHRFTKPFSDAPIPSSAPAQFVVETTAGFSDKFGIQEGDAIVYKRSAELLP